MIQRSSLNTAGGHQDQARQSMPRPWHSSDIKDTLAALGTDVQGGLSSETARQRLETVGPNRLEEERQVTFWKVAKEEVTEPMILLLLVVGVLYALWGEVRDAIAIFLIISGISLVEILNEYSAKAAIASLQRLASPAAPVMRDGVQQELDAKAVVPGDLVLLVPGERVPADLRIVEATALRIDESSLTGESAPVTKTVEAVPEDTELADRCDMAYAGTLVTSGKGRGVVVSTGMATEIGRIAGLVRATREPRTPLQMAMRQLAGYLVWLALGFSVLVPFLGYLSGQPLREMVLTGLTLAFATIPEELPILITVVLGLGSLRLSKRNAIVKRIRAAETLGSVSAIASDKTGTITENHMALSAVWLSGQPEVISASDAGRNPSGRHVLELGVLANDAIVTHTNGETGFAGDPTDVALVEAATESALEVTVLRGEGPLAEFTFDDQRKLTSALYSRGDALLLAVKGAPEAVIARCSRQPSNEMESSLDAQSRSAALSAAEAMANRGLRVLGIAYRSLPSRGESGHSATGKLPSMDECEADLVLAGLVGLADPPRGEVPAALEELRSARIRVLMLTGDHPATARAIAGQVGIDGGRVLTGRDVEAMSDVELQEEVGKTSVFARIAPEHKLRIVRALQSRGEVVAVTGDGVNDAPALKEAAIGVAMGQTGTDVAKEAADMVLADDNFATIGMAVREGRKLFENLRKAVRYYLAVKVALVGSSLIAVLLQLPVPFSPIQIIVTELFMDLGASVAFTAERAEGDVMARPPRDAKRPFMDSSMQAGIFSGGFSLCAAVIAAYLWAFSQGAEPAHAQSLAFVTWMIGHVLLALHMRSERQPLLSLGVLSNPAMVIWGVGAVALAVLAANVPFLSETLKMTPLSLREWVFAAIAPLVTTSWWEAWKLVRWGRRQETATVPAPISERRR